MQVIYTRLDNSTTTFTTNTRMYANVYIGNSITPSDNVKYKTLANTAGSGITAEPAVSMQGDIMVIYREYREVEPITDYGFSIWATERLTSEEHTVFTGQSAAWSGNAIASSDFHYWWARFTNDPHVQMQANV